MEGESRDETALRPWDPTACACFPVFLSYTGGTEPRGACGRSDARQRAGSLTQAKATLTHPCLRYMLLDRVEDGVARLNDAFSWQSNLTTAGQIGVRNQVRLESDKEIQTRELHLKNTPMLRQVRQALERSGDSKLYRFAVEKYEEQWDRPVVSCNGAADKAPASD